MTDWCCGERMAQSTEHRAKSKEQRAESREQRAESKGQRAESKEQRTRNSAQYARRNKLKLESKINIMEKKITHFRFMDLDVWKDSIEINDKLFDSADKLSDAKSFRVAEQLRGASLSISNNIAEGSGSFSDKDFANFLNMARRSVFETANISFVAFRRKFMDQEELDLVLSDLNILSRKITNFRKTLLINN
jgi:four helix bundle protein